MAKFCFEPIATIHSPFKEKFGTPRQPGLIPAARGIFELVPPYNTPETVRALETFSHLWLLFVFDRCSDAKWHPTVRPPRLGGNARVGVFASRSNFRPNPIGQSVVQLDSVDCAEDGVKLHVSNFDLLDQTPILDIKPYVRYADSLPDAQCSYAPEPPAALSQVILLPRCHGKRRTAASKPCRTTAQTDRDNVAGRPASCLSESKLSKAPLRAGGLRF